ncbi:hypothetical protein LTR46_010076 [Exophiala xenobiotica]|nr:hypothetical protein LTR46_010076 [Exophiala xenobiotica]
MADTLGPSDNIFQGLWTDWSQGSIWGLTWTLNPTHATILTNSLTLFVAIAGMQLWTIIRFVLHQMVTSSETMRTPHLNSEQVILRNASSDIATARHMLSLAWSSRRKSTGRRSLRSYAIGLLALIYSISFMTAGIFSNRAVSAASANGGSAVLSKSKRCGVWNQTYANTVVFGADFVNEDEFALYTQYAAKVAHDIQLSLEYAQECYLSQASTQILSPVNQPPPGNVSSLCRTFKSPKLTWKDGTGSCPFQPDMCQNKSEVIVLETDYIDSHKDLGINARPRDRLGYQRRMKCAALAGTGNIQGWNGSLANSSAPRPDPATAFAYYGPSLYKDTDFTYSYTNFASFYNNFTAQVTLPYQLDVELALGPADPQWTPSDFEPIPELRQNEADLVLFFLSFDGMYLGPNDDPWFSAHSEQIFDTSLPFLNKRYARDAAISTLGCTEQHQFCTPNGTCAGFLGFDQVQNVDKFNKALTPHQNATFDRMLRAATASSMRHLLENLALTTTPILANNLVHSGASGAVISQALPNNQWEMEIAFWHAVAMAQFQRTIVQWATGQIAPEPQYVQYLQPPTESQDIWFCNNLIIPSTVYESFSFVAIILVVTLGTLVILVSLTIERFAALIRKWFRKRPARGDWEDDNMLGIPLSMLGNTAGLLLRTNRSDRSVNSPYNAGHDSALQMNSPGSTDRRLSSQVRNNPSFSHLEHRLLPKDNDHQTKTESSTTPVHESWITIALGSPFVVPGVPTDGVEDNRNMSDWRSLSSPRPSPVPRYSHHPGGAT